MDTTEQKPSRAHLLADAGAIARGRNLARATARAVKRALVLGKRQSKVACMHVIPIHANVPLTCFPRQEL